MEMNTTMLKYLLIILGASFLFTCAAQAQTGKELLTGDAMPSFSLLDQNGKEFKTADYVGKKVLVIYFYPKDESMVCTKLPFTLLSDPDNKVYNQFGIHKKFFMTGRETFIVDLKGKIVYTHEAMMQGKEHSDDALAFIRAAKTK
jgi:peroxiredoxin Q/BCP